jgi:hypothetical protein
MDQPAEPAAEIRQPDAEDWCSPEESGVEEQMDNAIQGKAKDPTRAQVRLDRFQILPSDQTMQPRSKKSNALAKDDDTLEARKRHARGCYEQQI